jgi:two-component system, NtrC family, C4-dicarboxylate transport response regulator DctD
MHELVESRSPIRVLVVDDDPDFVLMVHDALSATDAGFAVDEATSAEVALTRLRGAAPDVILMDYQLGGPDGLTLLENLRAQDAAVPVVMVTGYPTPALRQRAEALGVSAFLIKPVFVPDLRRAVQQALNRG